MVLEATMICIDNSEWIRNGDYSPTLFDAQKDAVSLICGAKTQANPENTVGVLTMAGKGVRVLVTPTSDLGMRHGVEVGGEMNLAAGIQVAQLALKHRQNKKQQQRIIVFVGSPVKYDKKLPGVLLAKLITWLCDWASLLPINYLSHTTSIIACFGVWRKSSEILLALGSHFGFSPLPALF